MNRIGTKRIETERLILRRFEVSDAQDMFDNWASDPEVTKYLTWPAHSSVDVTKMLLEYWVSQYEKGDQFQWAIVWKATGRVVGSIAVVKLIEEIDAAEIGYCLSRSLWGKGVMTEAVKAVMNYLFSEAGLNRVSAAHDVRNPASGRVMEKAGMKLEGVWRQGGKNTMGVCDVVWRAALKSDFEKK